MSNTTRAAQMAATVEAKLKALGQMPEPKPEKPEPELEVAEQLARRDVLKKKLRSFLGG